MICPKCQFNMQLIAGEDGCKLNQPYWKCYKCANEIKKENKTMKICKECEVEIQCALYETGEEEYCDCQNTIDVDFDEDKWLDSDEGEN